MFACATFESQEYDDYVSEIAYLDICCFKAESCAARWFVTTDDRLLEMAMRLREKISIEVILPDQVPLDMEGAPS
jgi:hypothetical protein